MSSVFLCDICKEEYNETNRKPLSLNCGHVFCEACILTFKQNNDKNIIKCPNDNRIYKVEISQIPVCYQILTNIPKVKKKSNIMCVRHPYKKIKYFCKTHSIFPCSICVVDHMGSGHDLEVFEENNDRFSTEFNLQPFLLNYENELTEGLKLKGNLENTEKSVRDYYSNQVKKVDMSCDKIIQFINDKRKKFIEMFKNSHNEHIKNYEKDKLILSKKLDKLKSVHKYYYPILEDLLNKKKYEEFVQKRNSYTKEFQDVCDVKLIQENKSFMYFSNKFKFDDPGSISYLNSFAEIEKRIHLNTNSIKLHNPDAITKRDKEIKEKEHNIFKDNLMSNNNEDFNKIPLKDNKVIYSSVFG